MTRGERLRRWIEATFQTPSEAARRSGMSPQQMNDYLTQRRNPGPDILARWAALGLDIGWYLTGVTTRPIAPPGDADATTGETDDAVPSVVTESQTQNFRFLEDDLAGEPLNHGRRGIAAVYLARVMALRRQAAEIAAHEDAALIDLARAISTGE